ncbi:MAG TPA: trypsin-like peptidase domain-containing protein [Steroidobacteraceae bacterium]|nr:trypsin-like peptidase domain-containing protein [Steroidobacteraceae bacterium]HXS19578.1 trypsin-like peptidase domain-containing protein [Steroidobacteraceae bacterium]
MLERLSRGLTFIAGSVVGGLALAFVIVAVRPDLIRGGAGSQQPPAPASAPAPVQSAPPASGPAHLTYAGAVQRAAPAVVNIYTAREVVERVDPSPLGELFGDVLPRYEKRYERSLGSGVIVDASGHIVTNYHVIANAGEIRVQLADGRIAQPQVVGADPDTDLAVLKVNLPNLPVITFGNSDDLRVGDIVLAIGDPLGLSQTVTHGIVSATARGHLGITTFEDFIQTDAPINFGNSGGALVDSSGALIGINTAIVAKSLGVEGIGFAIPVDMVRGVLHDIVKYGRVIRGWIGIVPEDISDMQAQQFGLAHGGVVIAYVASPGQEAGFKPGDLLLSIDGTPVTSAEDARARIASSKPGTTLTVRYQRGSSEFSVKVRVAERPPIAG